MKNLILTLIATLLISSASFASTKSNNIDQQKICMFVEGDGTNSPVEGDGGNRPVEGDGGNRPVEGDGGNRPTDINDFNIQCILVPIDSKY